MSPGLTEVRRRALARFETPDALAAFLTARVLGLIGAEPALGVGRDADPTQTGRSAGIEACPIRSVPAALGRVVVDPTCGSGALLAPAARHGCAVYGVDLDPAAVGAAARRLGTVPGGRIKVGNALLDPVGPRQWPGFVSDNRELMARLAELRRQGRYGDADRMADPVRDQVAQRLPEGLRPESPFCWPLEFPEVFLAGGFDAVLTNPPWDKLKLHARECFAPDLRQLHESEQRRARTAALADDAVRAGVEAEKRAIGAFRTWLRTQGADGQTKRADGQAKRADGQAKRADGQAKRGDANAYLAVLDLAHDLLKPDGTLGAIVPGGLWTDLSALAWRQRLFDAYADVATWGFEARTDAFPDIDQRAAVFAGRRKSVPPRWPAGTPALPDANRESAGTPALLDAHSEPVLPPDARILVHGGLSALADLTRGSGYPVPIALIRATSPESLAIPPLADPLDAAIVEKLYRAGPPFAAGAWRPEFGREIDMTLDADVFDGVAAGSPLWEGKRIGAFELCPVDAVTTGEWPGCKPACSRAGSCPFERRNGQQLWVDEARLGSRDRGHARDSRVAWRSVARADRARRLEAALIPAGYRLGNSLNYVVGDRYTLEDKLTLLALLNSLVVEWRFRQLSNNNNVNLFAIRQLPLPEGADPALFEPARALMLAQSDAISREQLRVDLEARVARRFGLSASELARILAGFPKLQPQHAIAIQEAFGGLEPGDHHGRRNQTGDRAALGRARQHHLRVPGEI